MSIYKGRIYEIVIVHPAVALIIVKKKHKGNYSFVALTVKGNWKDKALIDLALKQGDKIMGNLHLQSREYNGKWYTDAIIEELIKLEDAPIKISKKPVELDLFKPSVNKETGEIIE